MNMSTMGNTEILKLPKTAFLCSRQIPASVVLKCYDWAIAEREKNTCIISGFHSGIEKDVFHFLLAGTQPVILALARGLKIRIPPELKTALDNNRLLIISPFEPQVKWISLETSETRNRFMLEMADEITIGYASPNGMLERLVHEFPNKKISWIYKT